MTRLDEAMTRFARIPGARVGHGPRHPVEPDPGLAQRLHDFLGAYPSLAADSGYIEFLEKYAGAAIQNEGATQLVDLLGFSDVAPDIVDLDGPVVDDEGFLVVAQAIYHLDQDGRAVDTLQHDIAFDASGRREHGIYHSFASGEQLEPRFTRQHDDFTSWLEDLIAVDGWLSPPGRPR